MISFQPVVRARRSIIAAFLIAAGLAAPGLLRLRTDNSPAGFFVRDHAALEDFRQLEDDFGRDHGLRVVIEGERLWTPAALDAIGNFAFQLGVMDRGLGGVYAVAGPARHHRWHLQRWPPADAEALRRLALADELDRNAGWVAANGNVLTVIVGLFELQPQREALTLAAIDERMSALEASLNALSPSADAHVYAVGLPIVSRAVDRGQALIVRFVLPMLLLIAAGLLAILFRSVAGVLLPLTLVAITQITAFGLVGYAGQRIDFVSSLLVPLSFVITLATGVHVLAFHRRLLAAGIEPHAAVIETYRVKAWPVLWTGVTTCAGFASLAASSMPSVRALGLWTAFAIAFMTLAALSFYPALLAVFGGRAAGAAVAIPQALLLRGVHTAVGHRRAVYIGFGAVALIAVLGLPRLRVDTGVLAYFAPSHPVRIAIGRLEQAGLPAVSASLMIEAPAGSDGFDDPAVLDRLALLTGELRADPLVTGALSAGDLVRDVARHTAASPDDTADVARRLQAATGADDLAAARRFMTTVPDLRDLLAALLTEDGMRTRVALFTPMRAYDELGPVYRAAEEKARALFPGARVRVTGEYPLILAAQQSLLRTVVLSLLATFSVIAVVMRVLLRSTSLTVRSLLPNLWPVLLVLGVMGWAGIAIDATTVMVAAVVLGLAVDDTLHTLGHVRLRAAAMDDRDPAALIEQSMAEVAGGHVITSVILCLGFLVPMTSDLVPVERFGMLSALAVAAALAADLLLVPALLADTRKSTLALLAPHPGRAGD
ncbi:MAG: MMPL family transporter [Acidobacteriota bacterium]